MSTHSLSKRMYPRKRVWQVVYFLLLAATGVLMAFSVGVSIWSQMGEEGWVTKVAVAVFSWIVTLPFFLGSLLWWITLMTRPQVMKQSLPAASSTEQHGPQDNNSSQEG